MSAYTIDCVICGAEHGYDVLPGEPAVMYYRDGSGHPGSDPEVDWRQSGCECGDHPAVNHVRYWDMMHEAALESARDDG